MDFDLKTVISLVSLFFGGGALIKVFSLGRAYGVIQEKLKDLERLEDFVAKQPSLQTIKLEIIDAVSSGNRALYAKLDKYYQTKEVCKAKREGCSR